MPIPNRKRVSPSAPATRERATPDEGALWQSLLELQSRVEQLTEASETRNRVLQVLGAATAQETVDGICRSIVEGVREALYFDRVGLFLWDGNAGCFRGTFGTALDGQTTDEHHVVVDPWPGSPWEQIVQGATLLHDCPLGEPAAFPGEEDVKADLVALRFADRLYGVISTDNRVTRTRTPEEVLEHLTLLSQILGNTVELSQARAALARSEKRLRQVAERNGEWVWELDEEGRYSYVHPVVAQVLGYAPGEVIGRHVLDFVADRSKARMTEVLRRARDERKPVDQVRHVQIHKDGHEVTLVSTCIPILREGAAVEAFWGSHRDVTVERRVEEKLRNAEKMEAVGRLAGGVAHDFNNLLTTILGECHLALGELDDADPLCEDIRQIREAGERAARRTRQLLAFSRKQILRAEPTGLNELLVRMQDELRGVMGEGIEVVIRTDPGLHCIEADVEQLRQVVLNLATNAREAMVDVPVYYQPDLWPAGRAGPEGPRPKQVILETRNVTLDEAACAEDPDLYPGEYAQLCVTDTGVGIPDDFQDHIFEPFFTTKEVGEGPGLGLSTAYGVIRQMGGDIRVQSVPGEGTTFRIVLPRPVAEADGVPAEGEDRETLRGTETVLVVEDEEKVRDLMVKMLAGYGYRTLQAPTGADALALCLANPAIDLVITDMVMPRMSGKAFAEELQKLGRPFKVLFTSGYSKDQSVNGEILGSGAPFIQKPFTRDQLVRRVRAVLDAR